MSVPCPECGADTKNVGTYFGDPDGPTRVKQMCCNTDCYKFKFTTTKGEIDV